MKKIAALALTILLLSALFASPAYAANEKNAVSSIELVGERNTEADPAPVEMGWAGTAITVGDKDIVITALGRMFFSDANVFHCVLVVNSEDGSLLNENTITVQGYDDSVDGTFEYYYLEEYEYITLSAGKTYYICSDFYGPLDHFYDSCTVTSTDDIRFVGTVELNLDDGSWIYTDAPGIDCLPVDFIYYVAGEEEAAEPTEAEGPKIGDAESEEADIAAAPEEAKNEPALIAPAPEASVEAEAEQSSGMTVTWIAIAAAVVIAAVVVLIVKKRKKAE